MEPRVPRRALTPRTVLWCCCSGVNKCAGVRVHLCIRALPPPRPRASDLVRGGGSERQPGTVSWTRSDAQMGYGSMRRYHDMLCKKRQGRPRPVGQSSTIGSLKQTHTWYTELERNLRCEPPLAWDTYQVGSIQNAGLAIAFVTFIPDPLDC